MSVPVKKKVSLTEEEFVQEAKNLIEKAQNENVILRILGALAIYIHSEHSPRCIELHKGLERLGKGKPMFTDLDLMGYKKQRKEIKKFFIEKMKYIPDRYINALFGGKRNIYYHPQGAFYVDVFFSKLMFSHDVEFGEKPGKGRLELDFPTITLTDLVLEKTQIHQINLKDIVDLIVLFLGHDVFDKDEKELINGKYIAQILADDWGFWYDATNNLEKVKSFTQQFVEQKKLEEEEGKIIASRVDKLLQMIENEPKTKKWQKRAKKGTKKIWYRQVEEVER